MCTSKPAINCLLQDISFWDSFGQEPLSGLLSDALSHLGFLLVTRFWRKIFAPGRPRNDDLKLGRPAASPGLRPRRHAFPVFHCCFTCRPSYSARTNIQLAKKFCSPCVTL